MGSIHKNSQLMLEFLKGPFLVLHFSCCILMTILMMVSVIWLSVLMIVLSILSVIRHLICGNNLFQLVSFGRSNNNGSIDVKMDEPVLEEKSSFKMLGLTFFSKLDWDSYIISIAKTASKKIGALICFMKFLSPEVALYLYKSSTQPCMEYRCQVWAVARSCYLELLDKLQK